MHDTGVEEAPREVRGIADAGFEGRRRRVLQFDQQDDRVVDGFDEAADDEVIGLRRQFPVDGADVVAGHVRTDIEGLRYIATGLQDGELVGLAFGLPDFTDIDFGQDVVGLDQDDAAEPVVRGELHEAEEVSRGEVVEGDVHLPRLRLFDEDLDFIGPSATDGAADALREFGVGQGIVDGELAGSRRHREQGTVVEDRLDLRGVPSPQARRHHEFRREPVPGENAEQDGSRRQEDAGQEQDEGEHVVDVQFEQHQRQQNDGQQDAVSSHGLPSRSFINYYL